MTTPTKARKPAVFRLNKKEDTKPAPEPTSILTKAVSKKAAEKPSASTIVTPSGTGQQDLSGSLHLQDLSSPTEEAETQAQKTVRRPKVVKTAKLTETPFPVESAPHINDDGSDDYMENDWEKNHTIAAAAIPSIDEIKKGLRWGNILFSAITALVGLVVLGWVTGYITELYKRHDILGWITLGVVAIIGIAFLALIIKEFWSMRRLKNMHKLRIDAELAVEKNDSELAKTVVDGLEKVLGHRKDLKWAFGRMKEHEGDIRDGREIITLTERELMKPLDIQARQIVANAAKRVSVVTAISPFAILDMGFVAYANIKMLRSINLLYGGKPGTFSTFRIIGMIVTHLAIAGGAALAEDMMKHVLTTSMAAKLSARLGQGLLNGGLTARIGIVATTLMRPLPYIERKPPNFKAMVKEVFRTKK